jgi:D-threonate/D-erythronate kinase
VLNHTSRVLAIADDMTGALEVGAKLSELGSSVSTTTEFAFGQEHRAVVLDTETRHLPGVEAEARIHKIAKAARQLQIEVIYKKTDSTLRGNVGPEICAIANAYPEKAIVFIPAYPKLGRTVRHGDLHVDGVPLNQTAFACDALNPVRTSHVPDLLGECLHTLYLHEGPPAGQIRDSCIHIFDSQTEADVAGIVNLALAESPLPVLCGPGSVAGHLAAALGCSERRPELPIVTTAMVVNGSRHEVSMRQIEDARNRGWPLLSADEMRSTSMGWAILSVEGSADRTGEIVGNILRKTRIDCLIVFGGDTAHAILHSLAVSSVIPIGELFPGIPMSRVGQLQLLTKAGGFGPVDLLSKIREVLSARG